MKRLKANQLGPWCSFCNTGQKKRAVFRQDGFSGKFACDEHKQNLMEYEMSHNKSCRLTEADYQTWIRL